MSSQETPEDRAFEATINPLQFHSSVKPPYGETASGPDPETVLSFLCAPGFDREVNDLVERFRKISKEKVRLVVAPREERILRKLVWPLRNAKASFMLGNHLGTISLCAAVGETLTLLLLDLSTYGPDGKPKGMTMHGGESVEVFENMSQEERIRRLRKERAVEEAIADLLDLIRATQRRYLPLWPDDGVRLERDAVAVYHAAVAAVVHTLDPQVSEGKVVLPEPLVNYLEQRRMIDPNWS
jgi:hypothetical protein